MNREEKMRRFNHLFKELGINVRFVDAPPTEEEFVKSILEKVRKGIREMEQSGFKIVDEQFTVASGSNVSASNVIEHYDIGAGATRSENIEMNDDHLIVRSIKNELFPESREE